MKVLTSDNVELYVKISGQGKPCLFLHGGPGAWSFNFEVLGGNKLEDFFEMIYLDQRGCGRSGKVKDGNYSIERILEDIEELRKKLKIDKWIIMAHSFGGILAVNYVKKYQENVEALILLSCTLNMIESFQHQIKYGMKLLNIEEKEEILDEKQKLLEKWNTVIGELIKKNLFYHLQFSKYESFERVNEIDSQMENDFEFSRYVFNSSEYFKNFKNLTQEIDIPVLIVSGDEDHAIGPEHYKGFKFKNATISILKGKHVLYLENIQELFKIIKEFVNNLQDNKTI